MKTNIENIKSNWDKYESLLNKLSDPSIEKMVEAIGERLLMCPASMKNDQYGCYPGGLVEHSLDVALTMRKINEAMNMNIQSSSILKVALLHEIGKIGDENLDYFVEQDSDWHVEKLGQHYKYNEKIDKMSISHRTLYLLQKFHIELTREEWIAIKISGGSHFEENRFYVGSETDLGILLQKSKTLAIHRATHTK